MSPSELPRFRWALVLGLAGFAAGFFGPLIFSPDANQGPLVGILISGPAGVVLGLLLQGICTVFKVTALTQWRLLSATAALGALAVLLSVQPAPALLGYVMDLEVRSCATPIAVEDRIVQYWSKRVANVTWATPRPGWQQEMHETLVAATGAMLEASVVKRTAVWEQRKPWNRGRLFSAPAAGSTETGSFFDPQATCEDFPEGREFTAWEKQERNPVAPTDWPPRGLFQIIDVSTLVPVPAVLQRLPR